MQTRRWINQSQPQTLVIAVFLLYFTAASVLLFGNSSYIGAAIDGGKVGHRLFVGDLGAQIDNFARLFLVVGGIAGGYLSANERKIGYWVALGVAGLPLVADILVIVRYQYNPLAADLIGPLFDVALFALLVHDQTRNYVRVWFK